MRLVAIFLFLSFLLMKGDTAAYAGTSHRDICYVQPHYTQDQELRLTPVALCNAELTDDDDDDVEPEKHYFITEDVEEPEDTNDPSGGKYKPVPGRSVSFDYLLILSYLHNNYRVPPSTFSQVSYKYLLQGVLRI
ncbi:MAG: hypothetical protein QM731_21865 [Chitinophagaceae bacterium]